MDFKFAGILDQEASQEPVFETVAESVVRKYFNFKDIFITKKQLVVWKVIMVLFSHMVKQEVAKPIQ